MVTLIVEILRLCLWLVILSVIFVPFERLFALHPRPADVRSARLWEDLGFYFLNSLVPTLLLSAPMALVVAVSHRIVPTSYFAWIESSPLWPRLIAGFVVGEIGYYWGHRLSHAVPFLWRFHVVHHRPQHIDWLVNTRVHPFDMVFGRLCGLVPIYLLDLAGPDAGANSLPALLFIVGGTIWGFVLHVNAAWRLGPFEHVIASPRFHHWHHTGSGPIDRNFASTLPVIDRLFGTQHLPKGAWPKDYGVSQELASATALEHSRDPIAGA
jgi:sterol desaturase/sphingolipid hydroxylase (fatty acid hydroxylase superfamily)